MMECEGHDKESAQKICGKIAQEKLAGTADKKPVALTGLATELTANALGTAHATGADLWIVYLPKGDHTVEQTAGDGSASTLRVNPSPLSAKRMEAALRLTQGKPAGR
jgi:hypothetical protein